MISGVYDIAIGLETHVQLNTRTKIFCGCLNRAGQTPNTDVCPVCLGYPGALPVLNREAVRLTVIAGLMLGSRISSFSKFDRKNYFYPDMPKNYQVSQFDKPFCLGGAVTIDIGDESREINITRIHLEEDVAKNTHSGSFSGVDFNRAGTPLMEIVSEPELRSPEEAFAYLNALKEILTYAGVSDCNLEEGNVRCDLNCSLRPAGNAELGVKTEIKNMNTFRGVQRALHAEIRRQRKLLSAGGTILQETLRYEDGRDCTVSMRSKEYAHDYRYFPEPDLMPVVLEEPVVEDWRKKLPEAPRRRRRRMVEQFGIPGYDAGVLCADRQVADFFEAACETGARPKAVANWVMTELLRIVSESGGGLGELRLEPRSFGRLVMRVDEGIINAAGAREVLAALLESGGDPDTIIAEHGLAQVQDSDTLSQWVRETIAAHSGPVNDYRDGKQAALQFLVGQIMRLSRGKADPRRAAAMLKDVLDKQQEC